MTFLVLSRKPILGDIAGWLGPECARTVVVTTALHAGDISAERFRHVVEVVDYGEPAVSARIVELALRFGVERLASLNEVDVLRTAAARQLLGLPGQDMASAIAFRDKHVMKSLAAARGVPVARMRRVADAAEGREAALGLGYPLVVKPVAGGGSVGVRMLPDARAWDAVSTPGPLLVEEKVDEATFFIIDGLMAAGAVTERVVLQMGSGNFTYATGAEPVVGYSLPEGSALVEELTEFAAQVLDTLPPVPDETAFHMEIFRDQRGKLLLCEVASRAGGMGHAPTFAAVTGIDLNGASLRGQLGIATPRLPTTRRCEASFAGFPKRTGTLVRHPERLSHPDVVSYTALARAGDQLRQSAWVGDDVARLRVETPAESAIEQVVKEVLREYEEGTEWQ